MLSFLAWSCGSDFVGIGGIEVVMMSFMVISINRNKSSMMMSKDMESDVFMFVSVVSYSTRNNGSNLTNIGGIEMIKMSFMVISVNRIKMMVCRISETKYVFKFVSMISYSTRSCSSNFSGIGGIKVIMSSITIITVDRNRTREFIGTKITNNTFTSIPMMTDLALTNSADLIGVSGIEVIMVSRLPVTVDRK